MDNDYVVYRYADVLMMKGEALVRQGHADLAVPLFNEVRHRTGLDDYKASDLTLDEIYDERGREFAWEGLRRQDMIRFGKWGEARDLKPAVSRHTRNFTLFRPTSARPTRTSNKTTDIPIKHHPALPGATNRQGGTNSYTVKTHVRIKNSRNRQLEHRYGHLHRAFTPSRRNGHRGHLFHEPGGKGANQAVTVARLGGRVSFICKTGSDIFGHQANQLFNEEGIDTSYVFSDTKNPSGVALITVDTDAENCIVVAPGANAHLTPNDLKRSAEAVEAADIILLQLEIPMQTVEAAAMMAYRLGKKVVLNPAPASKLSAGLLETLYAITPNETEAEAISGIRITDERTAEEAARKIASMGVCNVIITLGAKGALVFDGAHCEIVPAYKTQAVDTTAAGDVFNGALVVALSEGRTLPEAVRFACKASAISVTRVGAQNSVPYRTEVDVFNL